MIYIYIIYISLCRSISFQQSIEETVNAALIIILFHAIIYLTPMPFFGTTPNNLEQNEQFSTSIFWLRSSDRSSSADVRVSGIN